jgi:hypothetical protein
METMSSSGLVLWLPVPQLMAKGIRAQLRPMANGIGVQLRNDQ